jgi:hypothetical protein
MESTRLPGTDVTLSRLTFGTGSLHHLPTTRERQYLLSAAADRGFTHFDTAPFYGFGLAERELGAFLKNRKNLTVTTKFGLYPPAGATPLPPSVWAFKLLGKVLPRLSQPVVDWNLESAKKSLELSLRRLGSDHVDFLLLHEPTGSIPNPDELGDWLRREKQKGTIRAWGLAGPLDGMTAWLNPLHPLGMVLQVRDDLDNPGAGLLPGRDRDLQFTYGYLSNKGNAQLSRTPVEILRLALQKNKRGSILVSTRRVDHLGTLASALGGP